MRYLMMHKHDAQTEAGVVVEPELVGKMGEFIGGFMAKGQFIDGAGLGASKTRTRLSFKNGACTTTHGPYSGEEELPTALLVLKVTTRDEGLAWAQRYGSIIGTAELELGKVQEAWDLGLMPEPEDAPLQLLLVDKADRATESGGRSPEIVGQLAKLSEEMTAAGVLQRGYQLQPSSQAKRLHFTDNKLRVVDGPFTESKEMIGGFAVLDLPSMDEIIATSVDYAALLGGTIEIDIRPIS